MGLQVTATTNPSPAHKAVTSGHAGGGTGILYLSAIGGARNTTIAPARRRASSITDPEDRIEQGEARHAQSGSITRPPCSLGSRPGFRQPGDSTGDLGCDAERRVMRCDGRLQRNLLCAVSHARGALDGGHQPPIDRGKAETLCVVRQLTEIVGPLVGGIPERDVRLQHLLYHLKRCPPCEASIPAIGRELVHGRLPVGNGEADQLMSSADANQPGQPIEALAPQRDDLLHLVLCELID
jgi:hypothetical protein